MLFNSLEFAVFFVAVFVVYAALSQRAQNRWLLVASYLFYSAWDWRFLGLILLSTLVDFTLGILLFETRDERQRKRLVGLSAAVNLGILGVFKYADFFADSLADVARGLGVELGPATLDVVLPVVISFYTFQTLGYTIDVYRRRLEPCRSLPDFALFVAFFPQLVAGPIERAERLLPQIQRPRRISRQGISAGSWLVLWGLFKKVVIGDNIAGLVNAVYAPGAEPYAPEVVLATYAFAVQIYCDFSGYTDIARGIGKILGFELMRNFNLPYFARNPSDFWRRWHISLSTWLRDYLYVPLGGNREGRLRTYRNLALTMLLGGLWHGAAWTFVLWGAFHGLILAIHRLARDVLERRAPKRPAGRRLWHLGSMVLMFHLTCFGWLLFRAQSLAHAADLLSRLGSGPWHLGLVLDWALPFAVLVTPLVLMQLAQYATGDLDVVRRAPLAVRAAVYCALLATLIVFGEDFGQPFIYFQF